MLVSGFGKNCEDPNAKTPIRQQKKKQALNEELQNYQKEKGLTKYNKKQSTNQ